jgi:P4 family phage/plasmid primase-like protien
MKRFHGVHEVRMLRQNGVAVGYFDNWDSALRAVESEPSQYKAAYFTLNPVNPPSGIALNPLSLNPANSAASGADIARRLRILIDLDPPRPPATNATDAEKRAAREQAEQVREWLCSKGWPAPALADSGNGWHLLYHVDLPNDAASTELIKGLLKRLKQLFPLVDAGNYDPSRISKLYGTWARKGEHTDERPWRRSGIVEEGEDRLVTAEQIKAIVPISVSGAVKTDDVKLGILLGFLNHYGVAILAEPREVPGGWQIEIECPWAEVHSGESRRETAVSFIAGLGNGFKCFHSHCADRRWKEFRLEMEQRNPGVPAYFGKLPPMTHSDIARRFVESHDDFVRIYDADNATGVWIPGKRWALSDPGDALLRMAIRRYLDELHDKYSPPEKGPDPRRALKQAAFVSGVLAEVKPWLPPKSALDFDIDPTVLPLPDGKVADLKRGFVREMRREDCQTKRLSVTPADIPTPRFDRFVLEIACGNRELADFIVRLMALGITGLALHVLIFFYGRGRNGKGVTLRLLEWILGTGLFAAVMKPDEVEYQKGASDRNKRLMGRLRGMRMCFTGETVGGNLDWTLLKLLTGGDTLSGAKLYKDEAGFKPSHTLFLLTNDRPVLPPTAAFKGRLVFVPFDADFSNSKDLCLEDDLRAEGPGVLWKLIKAAPSIFERGIEPPAFVLHETAVLMDENDVAAPFIDECLTDDADVVTPIPEIIKALQDWMSDQPGGLGNGAEFDRIMAGVKARWSHGRKRVPGRKHPVQGLRGVRIRPAEPRGELDAER